MLFLVLYTIQAHQQLEVICAVLYHLSDYWTNTAQAASIRL